MSTGPSISVSLTTHQWRIVSDLVRDYCRQLPSDWQKWGNQLGAMLQKAVDTAQRSGTSQEVAVVLVPQNWRTIMDAMAKASQRKGKDYIDSSNWICQKIQQALDGANAVAAREAPPRQDDANATGDASGPKVGEGTHGHSVPRAKPTDKTYYEILGVDRNATEEEIRERFRFLSQAYHPDKFATPEHKAQAEEDFKRISEAFHTLSDPERRAPYDERTFGQTTETAASEGSTPMSGATRGTSKSEDYYDKGMKAFLDSFGGGDKGQSSVLLSKAQGYLTMAYNTAQNTEEKKGVAGLMAMVLAQMDDRKNAEQWARAELSIDPGSVFARLALYWYEIDRLAGHKGFLTQGGGGGFGAFMDITTTVVDIGVVQGKKNSVKTAGIEAAKALDQRTRSQADPNPAIWVLWSWMLLDVIDNMWTNKMKEPYLCNVLLALPWNRCSPEDLKDIQDSIEEIQVAASGYLARLR